MPLRSSGELVALRKIAHDIASGRKERMNSVHLLAAIAGGHNDAAEILLDRKLDGDAVLKASRAFDDEGSDPIARLLVAARDVAARSRGEATAVHLLLAILADRGAAAHRALLQAGVDLARLRSAAMPIALGVVAARRPTARVEEETKRTLAEPVPPRTRSTRPSAGGPGVAVPLFPPPPRTPVEVTKPKQALAPSRPTMKSPPPIPIEEEIAPPSSSKLARFELDPKRFPNLASLGRNLTLEAASGVLDRVVGRELEIDRVLDVIAKRHANSACLVGPAGVGKTSVARGLAHRFASDTGPEPRVLVEIVVAELLAGTGARGALAERWAAIRNETREARGRVVVFVDEIHELFGPGAIDEASTEIKIALSRGELVLVGATTAEEYRRSIEQDAALARRFTVVDVDEPDEADAFLLLREVARSLGQHHRVRYEDATLASAVSWSMRYLPGRALPDKAIALLDFAGARSRRAAPNDAALAIRPAEVAAVVAEIADLPIERLLQTDGERFLALESLLGERVVGHVEGLAKIAAVLRKSAAGLRSRRPLGSFLLLGPTGVGKTETAKALAEALFHSADAMTRLDLSEYAESHSIARLIGAPPGYVGHEAGGQLTEAVRRRPYQVLLLDEIEKAHEDVLQAFLQVFDEGRLTDGRGRRVDFTNTVIVMTSNLGAREARAAKSEKTVGFTRGRGASDDRLGEVMIAAAKNALPPELYNRLDEVLCFAPLSRAEVAEVATRLLQDLEDALAARGITLDVDGEVVDALLDAGGYDVELGARPMRRTIGRLVEGPIAELILKGELGDGTVAMVRVEAGAIEVDAVRPKKSETTQRHARPNALVS